MILKMTPNLDNEDDSEDESVRVVPVLFSALKL
jgi:hypothetical protein